MPSGKDASYPTWRSQPVSTLREAPSAIPAKVDYQYFSVTQAGPCWEHLVKTRKLGLYVPGEIPDPDLELLVIVDS